MANTESPQISLVRKWLAHGETFDHIGHESLMTDTFTLETLDEHNKSHLFTRDQFLQQLKDVKLHNTRQEVCDPNLSDDPAPYSPLVLTLSNSSSSKKLSRPPPMRFSF